MIFLFSDVEEWERILDTAGPDTEADISFLTLNPDSKYQFRVIARNIIGISEYSDPSEFYSPPASGRVCFFTLRIWCYYSRQGCTTPYITLTRILEKIFGEKSISDVLTPSIKSEFDKV